MGPAASDWDDETWAWSPAKGRWSAKRHGAPGNVVHVHLDTDGLHPRDRYEFWRETALYDLDADRRDDGSLFRARAAGIIGPEGAVYVNRADALSGARRRGDSEKDGCDAIAIGLMTAGQREHEEGDERRLARAGQFLVYDARRESRVRYSDYATVHVTLGRQNVEAILGAPLPSSAALASRLEATPVGRLLASHMLALAGEMEGLGAEECAGVLGITLDLAYLSLRGIAPGGVRENAFDGAAPLGDGIFSAALQLIDANLARPDLDPHLLAKLLGCSRATLYRCFAEREATIAQVIRSRRLTRARMLLAAAPANVTIADIAMRCGYYDPGHFSRAFRRKFGVSPSDLRNGG